jgi:4-hydroxy-3-polyprenylbenzoate decarboxylase
MSDQKERLVVGISGASGVILGIRLLEVLRGTHIETHLVISPAARATIAEETDWKIRMPATCSLARLMSH